MHEGGLTTSKEHLGIGDAFTLSLLQLLAIICMLLRAGLLCCGDSTFPGIGLPAVAASGAVAANSLVSPWKHWALLDEIKT